MRAVAAGLVLGLACFAAGHAQASSPAQHSIEWYEAHGPEQAVELNLCVLHHSFLLDQDCVDANGAFLQHLHDEETAAESREQWAHLVDFVDANPAGYRCDKLMLPIVTRACHSPRTSATPPASWCAAVDEARREDGLL